MSYIFTPSFHESCKKIGQGLYLNYLQKNIFFQALYRSYCSSLAAAHRPPPPQGEVVKIFLFLLKVFVNHLSILAVTNIALHIIHTNHLYF